MNLLFSGNIPRGGPKHTAPSYDCLSRIETLVFPCAEAGCAPRRHPQPQSIMSSELIISVSGLRGIVGESLTPEVAIRYSRAFAASIGPGPILVARDGRTTGRMLQDAITSALQACGRDLVLADVAATPTGGVYCSIERYVCRPRADREGAPLIYAVVVPAKARCTGPTAARTCTSCRLRRRSRWTSSWPA